jgi:hypothetical protein
VAIMNDYKRAASAALGVYRSIVSIGMATKSQPYTRRFALRRRLEVRVRTEDAVYGCKWTAAIAKKILATATTHCLANTICPTYGKGLSVQRYL